MDALLPVFLATLLATVGDKAQLRAAALSAHYRRDGVVFSAILVAAALNATLASLAGAAVRAEIPFRAVGLLSALALIVAGAGALFPARAAKPLSYPALSAFAASLFAFAVEQFGDAAQFLTLALAARTSTPALAAIGGAAGVTVACVPAVLLGAGFPGVLPLRPVRFGCGIALLLTGLWAALDALRLI